MPRCGPCQSCSRGDHQRPARHIRPVGQPALEEGDECGCEAGSQQKTCKRVKTCKRRARWPRGTGQGSEASSDHRPAEPGCHGCHGCRGTAEMTGRRGDRGSKRGHRQNSPEEKSDRRPGTADCRPTPCDRNATDRGKEKEIGGRPTGLDPEQDRRHVHTGLRSAGSAGEPACRARSPRMPRTMLAMVAAFAPKITS